MKVCGLDLSTTSSGISVIEDGKIIYNELISPNKKDSMFDRMIYTQKEIEKVLKKYQIKYVGVEDVAISVSRNAKTCHDLLFLVGMICGLCNTCNINWKIFLPTHWRKVVGLYKEKQTREELRREYQKEKGISFANKIFGLNLSWQSDNEDKKNHNSDLAESALIALALEKELKEGE